MQIFDSRMAPQAGGSFKFIRSAVTVLLCLAILSFATFPRAKAGMKASAEIAGTLSARGTVKVNGQPAADGQTLFSASQIDTEAASESVVMLGNRSQLYLSALSELMIQSSEHRLTASLPTGRVLVQVPSGVSLSFYTADLAINKHALDQELTLIVRAAECEGTQLEVITGAVEAHERGRSEIIKSGLSLSTKPTVPSPQNSQSSFSNKKKLGIIFGIGGAAAILLAVALGQNDENQNNPGTPGCVVAPSGSGPFICP